MAKIAGIGQRALVEAVGVFFLTFIGAGAVIASQFAGVGSSGLLVVALANGLALALAVSFAMNISGGHINPAITVAAFVNRAISARDGLVYICAQLIGAMVAGFLLLLVYPSVAGTMVNYGTPALGASVSAMQGILFEAIMTFILAFTVMGTVVDQRAPKIAGFGVGLAVVIDVLAGGPFTGAAMNPARWFGPALASGFFVNWYVYIVGPLLGAIVAAVIYKYCVMK
ncbi:MAG: aquaporin [Candidatus Micrarchaeota archaeon]|nr:aquaporin [Candidatus Micrarchaeota archaeon]